MLDGDPTNNDATLLDVDGYLPTAEARPDAEAPEVDLMGRLFADPGARDERDRRMRLLRSSVGRVGSVAMSETAVCGCFAHRWGG